LILVNRHATPLIGRERPVNAKREQFHAIPPMHGRGLFRRIAVLAAHGRIHPLSATGFLPVAVFAQDVHTRSFVRAHCPDRKDY